MPTKTHQTHQRTPWLRGARRVLTTIAALGIGAIAIVSSPAAAQDAGSETFPDFTPVCQADGTWRADFTFTIDNGDSTPTARTIYRFHLQYAPDGGVGAEIGEFLDAWTPNPLPATKLSIAHATVVLPGTTVGEVRAVLSEGTSPDLVDQLPSNGLFPASGCTASTTTSTTGPTSTSSTTTSTTSGEAGPTTTTTRRASVSGATTTTGQSLPNTGINDAPALTLSLVCLGLGMVALGLRRQLPQ